MKYFPRIAICFCLLGASYPASAYIGLGPLIPVIGSFLIYFFVVLIAVIGVLGYPIKRLLDGIRKKNNSGVSNTSEINVETDTQVKPHNKPSRPRSKVITALVDYLGDLETLVLKRKFVDISHPIFICGLARSNTTLLVHILNSHPDTGSFLYKDLPFPSLPFIWSFFNKSYYRG